MTERCVIQDRGIACEDDEVLLARGGDDDAIRAIRVILQKLVDAIVAASNEARIREQVEMAGVSA